MFWLGWIVFTVIAVWSIPAIIALAVKKLLPSESGLQPTEMTTVRPDMVREDRKSVV